MYGLNAVRVILTSTSSAIETSRRRITSTVIGSISAGRGGVCVRGLSSVAVNFDLSELADDEGVARADQRARPILDDERGALPGERGPERRPIIDLGGQKPVLLQEEDRPHLELRASVPAGARLQ